jgi:hypothetical protein
MFTFGIKKYIIFDAKIAFPFYLFVKKCIENRARLLQTTA